MKASIAAAQQAKALQDMAETIQRIEEKLDILLNPASKPAASKAAANASEVKTK